ncbi:MAG: ABC transporter permease, partial [Spirochaetia bacterium]
MNGLIDLKRKQGGHLINLITLLVNRNEFFLACAFILLLTIGGSVLPGFMTLFNISSLLQQLSILGLMSLGMTFVIIGGNGGIDLSVGSIFGIAAIVSISLQNKVVSTTGTGTYSGLDLPLILILLLVLLCGFIIGFVNGFGVTKLRVPPFIMTLITMTIGRGLIMLYTQGYQFKGIRNDFAFLGGKMFWDFLPMPLIIFAFLA